MQSLRPRAFVKWAGGKQGIATTLVGMFPKRFKRYYEPFLGGGSVLFAVRPKTAICGDENEWLLDTYVGIRDSWEQVAEVLEALPNTKEDFLRIRAIKPADLSLVHRAAHFIYLNKTCFRGLFRVNRQGGFNVPYGKYDRRYFDPAELAAVSRALQAVELRPGDFESCVADVKSGDFVYFDPPYYKLGGFSDFNRYTRHQFREADHERLAKVCSNLDQRKVKWAVSNSDTDYVRRLFDGFHLQTVSNRREINLKASSRDIDELFITNYETHTPSTLF